MKKRGFLLRILLTSALLAVGLISAMRIEAQDLPALPYFKSYTPQDFPGEQQNRWIIQDSLHNIIVANSGGLLQHGDRKWRLFASKDITFLSALRNSSSRSNTIWAGSFSNIGYFEHTDSTLFAYRSLTERLPDSLRNFSNVIAIQEFDGHVYFLNDLYLFSYDLQTQRVELAPKIYAVLKDPEARITAITVWRDRLCVFINNGTLITIDSNEHVERIKLSVPSGNSPKHIVAASEWNDQLLIGDQTEGLYLWSGSDIQSFETAVTSYLSEHHISDIAVFETGNIAVSTVNGGTVMLSPEGKFQYVLSDKTGLVENVHNQLYIDHNQDLWIAGNESITKVYTGVPLKHLNGNIFGFGDAVQLYHGANVFYVGGMNGLYRYNENKLALLDAAPSELFTEISGVNAPFWGFCEVDDELWTASNAGVFEIQKNRLVKRFDKEAFWVGYLSDTQLLIVTSNGVDLVEKQNGQWIDRGSIGVASFFVYGIAVTSPTTFWVGGVQGQLAKITYDPARTTFEQKIYTQQDGLLRSDAYEPVELNGQLIVNSNNGYMRYDPQEDRFNAFSGLNNDLGSWGEYLSLDKAGNYWSVYVEDDYRGIVKMAPETDSTWTRHATVFELSDDHFGDFIDIDDQRIWVGSTESIMIHELYDPINSKPPTVSVWQVQSLFDQKVLSQGGLPDAIPYQQKRLRIDLTSSSFRYPEKNRYRYQLGSGNWSEWRSNPGIMLNEFFPGTYQLKVQTADFMGQTSVPKRLALTITAPWYMTSVAYGIYGLLLIGGVFLMVRGLSNYRIQRELEQVKVREAEKLIELDEMKNRLFANISHEFRTPLTISQGLVKKLIRQQKNGEGATATPRDLQVMNRNMNRLRDMVNQIIDLTKADRDHLKLNRNYYLGDQLVSISTESFRSLAEYHGHHYEVVKEVEDAILFVDRSKVEIIINNLISNAIKFTNEGGQILIKAFIEDNVFHLLVSDTGPGIPKGDEEAIFERFYRIEQDGDNYVEGMGVGLELSRTLARLHGGDIRLMGDQDQGAGFLLTLPITNDGSPHQVIELEEEEWAEVTEKAVSKTSLPNANADARRLLLVEDNQDMMAYVSEILSETAQVQTAANGEEALDYIRDTVPDLIITDLMMPKMDGATLIETLSEHPRWKDIPVIVLTAKAIPEHKTELLRIGVVDYITKPFEPHQLMLKVRNLLTYAKRRLEIADQEEGKDTDTAEADSFNQQVIDYIRERLADPNLTVDELVGAFPQSRRSFYRNIQRSTGMTPSELIREVRFKAARSMVQKDSDQTLSELASAVGYKSATSFRKGYEKRFGEHPLEG
jgi:signal transduction histidine kinase/CheY-like chemotaxis protein/AraC-like DNA-binding protein